MSLTLAQDEPVAATARTTAQLHPRAPRTAQEAGLGEGMLTELVLKQLQFGADFSGVEIGERLGLEFSVVEDVLAALKHTHDIEVFGGAMGSPSYRYRITDSGRRRALLLFEQSRYVGVAPVPLAQYQAYMRAFHAAAPHVANRARVRQAFSHLVLSDRVLDQVGTAAAAGHSMFVYGPPGNGKTVIAQGLRNLLDGEIAIPHALEVEGQIIRLFDPVNHEPLPVPPLENSLMRGDSLDNRWVRCRRPMVTVGGELTLDALDLTYSESSRFYNAPIQAVANGGVLVIDDFGRQHASPRDLLNRWVVPLESGVDYLTLKTGQKFDVPFMTMVVFATNLKPSDLVDEAFLRRVQFKVLAENPTDDDFRLIFERVCADQGLTCDPDLVSGLLNTIMKPRHIVPRGCQPRDLVRQALALADYTGEPRVLTLPLLEAACATYFVDETTS